LLAAIPLCAGFWYWRGYHHTGWPLYPMQVTVAGHTFGSGISLSASTDDIRLPYSSLGALVYPWFEWKGHGYNYAVDSGLGPAFATFAVMGTAYFLFQRRLHPTRDDRRVKWLVAGFAACGAGMFFTVLHLHLRYSLPLWIIMLAACAPLAAVVVRFTPRTGPLLVTATLAVSAVMIGLRPAKPLLGRLRDGDLSRAHAYELPRLFDEQPAGTVVLNLAAHGANHPLRGARLHNRVIDTMRVLYYRERGELRLPLSRADLEKHEVDLVYTRGTEGAPFGADVVAELVYDDSNDPARPASTVPTRVYRVRQVDLAMKGRP
jgi:hypothetical protein